MDQYDTSNEQVKNYPADTNAGNICSRCTVKRLAEILIQLRCGQEVDYDYEDEPFLYTQMFYVTSDDMEFEDYDDAVEHEIGWLISKISLTGDNKSCIQEESN